VADSQFLKVLLIPAAVVVLASLVWHAQAPASAPRPGRAL